MNIKAIFRSWLTLSAALFVSKSALACVVTPSFTYTSTHTCGLPTIVSVSNTSTGNMLSSTKFWWKVNGVDYSDTIVGKAAAVIYLKTTGVNTIVLYAKDTGACIDTSMRRITVTSNAKTILDQNQTYSYTPSWMNCLQFTTDPDSFRINFQSADTLKNLRIFWGDGSKDSSGINLNPNTVRTHLYTRLGIFNLKIVTTNGTCTDTVYGIVYNQRQPTAGIIGPPSGTNRGCAPHTMRIINNSYNISDNTKFLIEWGDGKTQTEAYTKYRDSFYHTYKKGICAGIIKITATNVCGSSFSTWNPIDISEKDKARWAVTNACSPNTDFVFQNLSSDMYCLIPDIKDYFWDFGDSSTIGWTSSKASQAHRYKREGDYTVMLIARTACGNDTFRNRVRVYFTPSAGFRFSASRSCKPLITTLTDTSKGRGYTRTWTVKEGSVTKTFSDSVLNYTFTTPGSHTVTLSISNVCGTSTQTKTFVVTDKPDASFAPVGSACVPVTVSFSNTSTSYFGNASYSWDFGDSSSSSLKNPPARIYSKPGNYTVRLIVSDSCGTDTFLRNFTAHSLPLALLSTDSSACTFDSVSIINRSRNASSYDWSFGDNTGSSNTDTGVVKHVYNTAATYTIRLIASTAAACKDTAFAGIVIKPGAKADFSIDKAYGCAPAKFRFSNQSVYGKDYRWFANGVPVSSSSVPGDTILSSDSSVVRMKLIATSISSCQSDSVEKTFFTAKNPIAAIGNRDSGCGPLPVAFVNSSSWHSSSYWTLGNGITSTQNTPQTIYAAAPGKDTVYYPMLIVSSWAGCKDTTGTAVRVYPAPLAAFSANTDRGCGPLDVTFTNLSASNSSIPFGSLSHRWSFGDGSSSDSAHPLHSFLPSKWQDTLYRTRLIVSSPYACKDTAETSIRVYPQPLVSFTPDKTSGCALLPVSFSNHSHPRDTGNISLMRFHWNAGNGDTGSSLDFNSVYSGSALGDSVYSVVLKGYSEHGCTESDTVLITLHPQPLALFTLLRDDGCTPMSAVSVNQSVSRDGGVLTHAWDFGNGYRSSLENDSSVYFNNSDQDLTYTLTYTATSQYGCADTATAPITVRPKPRAGFYLPQTTFCAPALVQVRDSSVNAAEYYWGEGNSGFSGTSSEQIYLQGLDLFDTTYVIAHQVLSAYGCKSDTVYRQVLLYGRPVADFRCDQDSACAGSTLQWINTSYGAYRYRWDFGDGSVSASVNPRHAYPALAAGKDSIFQVSLQVSSFRGCKDTALLPAYVVAPPSEDFSTDKTEGCSDLLVRLHHKDNRYRTQYWDFGDFSNYGSGDSLSHLYINNSLSDVLTPRVTLYRKRFQCTDTASAALRVFPVPRADFRILRPNPCDSGVYSLLNLSSGHSKSQWYKGNTLLSDSMETDAHLPSARHSDTLYRILLISSNAYGCSDSSEQILTPKRKMLIRFGKDTGSVCENTAVRFQNLSLNAVRYLWDFGDGYVSSDPNPVHTYTRYGNYPLRLYAFDKDGCTDSSTALLNQEVIEIPVAGFGYAPPFPRLPNAMVSFYGTPVVYSVSPDQLGYEWDFGDLSFPTANKNEKDPVHTYTLPGTVLVSMTVWNRQCTARISKPLFIEDPKPVPGFTPDTLYGCVPLRVNFKNQTTNVDSYRWIFGDGSPESYEKEPSHVFTLPGRWTVTLVATGSGGTSTLSKQYLITTYPKPILEFYSNTVSQYLPNAVFNILNFSNTASNAWQLTDSLGTVLQSSEKRDPAFIINTQGRYTLTLIGTSDRGCTDTLSKQNYLSTQGAGFVYVPDAFSPGKNGKNDLFFPSLLNVKEEGYLFSIYNRWGELIWQSTDIRATWDGTYQGKPCEQDVYIWTLSGTYYNEDDFVFRGNVTLLR